MFVQSQYWVVRTGGTFITTGLDAADVNYEDRQVLLGHKNDRITTHYSGPEILNLIEATTRVCEREQRRSFKGKPSNLL